MALEEKSKYSNTTFSISEFSKFQEYNSSGEQPALCSYRQGDPDLSSSSTDYRLQDDAATKIGHVSNEIDQCNSAIEVFALMEHLMDECNIPSFFRARPKIKLSDFSGL